MDLSDFSATDDLVFQAKNPKTKELLPINVSFHNVDTQAFRAATNAAINAHRKFAQKGTTPTAEQSHQIGLDFLASVAKSWTPAKMKSGGQEYEFNKANFLKVISAQHWLREQVDEFLTEARKREGFTDLDDTAAK